MKKLKLEDWVTMHRQRKWKWTQRLATRNATEWTTIIFCWDPTLNSTLRARRRPGRPKRRWTDDVWACATQSNPTNDHDNDNEDEDAVDDCDADDNATTDAMNNTPPNDDNTFDNTCTTTINDQPQHNNAHDNCTTNDRDLPNQTIDHKMLMMIARDVDLWAALENKYVTRAQ